MAAVFFDVRDERNTAAGPALLPGKTLKHKAVHRRQLFTTPERTVPAMGETMKSPRSGRYTEDVPAWRVLGRIIQCSTSRGPGILPITGLRLLQTRQQ